LSLLSGLGLPGFSGFLVGGGAVSGLVPGFGDGAGAGLVAFGFGSSVGLSLLKGLGLPGFSGFLVGGGAVSGLVPGFGDGAGAGLVALTSLNSKNFLKNFMLKNFFSLYIKIYFSNYQLIQIYFVYLSILKNEDYG